MKRKNPSDGTKEFATTDSMDGCNVLPEIQFVGTRLRVDTTRVLYVGGTLPPWGAAGERSEFDIKPPLGAPLLIFPRGYPLKSSSQVDITARRWGFEIRVFPLLCELPKAIEPHLPVIPLATRSQHVVFTYDQVVRPHHSYRPSGGLPRGKPRTRHMWICLQLSGARGVDNGGIRAQKTVMFFGDIKKNCNVTKEPVLKSLTTTVGLRSEAATFISFRTQYNGVLTYSTYCRITTNCAVILFQISTVCNCGGFDRAETIQQ